MASGNRGLCARRHDTHNLCILGLLLPCPAPDDHPDYTTGHPECSGSFLPLSTYLPEDWGPRTWAKRVLPPTAARAQTLYRAHHRIRRSKRFVFFDHGINAYPCRQETLAKIQSFQGTGTDSTLQPTTQQARCNPKILRAVWYVTR